MAAVVPGEAAEAVLKEAERSGLDARTVALRAITQLMGTAAAAEASKEPEPSSSSTIALSLKVGSVDGLRPGDVVGMLVHEGGLQPPDIGRIDILPQITMVEVPEAAATHLVGAMHRAEFRSRRVMPRLAPDWNFKAHRGPPR